MLLVKRAGALSAGAASSEDGVSQSRDHRVVPENGTNTLEGKTKRENLSDIVQVLG